MLRAAATTSRVNFRQGRHCDPARRLAAGPLRERITLVQGPDYERLPLCPLRHGPLRGCIEATRTKHAPSRYPERTSWLRLYLESLPPFCSWSKRKQSFQWLQNWSTWRVAPSIRRNCCSKLCKSFSRLFGATIPPLFGGTCIVISSSLIFVAGLNKRIESPS